MSRRVYLAAPWVERWYARQCGDELENNGFTITHKWWNYEGEGQDKEPPEFLQDCAEHDVQGVLTADVVIVINSVKSEGKAVETGMAIVAGIPICLIGKKSLNIFYHLPQITKVETLEEAIEWALQETD